jgi:filamentous hemagglutinin family protein
VAGSGSIHGSGSGLTIDQNSTRGIIDWQGFSIGQGRTVQFDNGSGATLNEVTGNNLSQIAGSLKATGSVYLVNPDGIIVTPTGQVVTEGSFVATTRDVDSANFMAGSGIAISGSSANNVVNQGSITSADGDVVLFGHDARSTAGSHINAAHGSAALLAGRSILYRPGANSQILVKGGTGNAANHGTIQAAQAELAAAGGNVYAMAGNDQGSIEATGTATLKGHVWLTAGGQTQVSGSISASNANGTGGTIVATGNSVQVGSRANISANGTSGGTVLIGGDEQGGSDPSETVTHP